MFEIKAPEFKIQYIKVSKWNFKRHINPNFGKMYFFGKIVKTQLFKFVELKITLHKYKNLPFGIRI